MCPVPIGTGHTLFLSQILRQVLRTSIPDIPVATSLDALPQPRPQHPACKDLFNVVEESFAYTGLRVKVILQE